jgi:DNA-directed RNA polymerase specialized sigma24 family protein
MTTEATHDLSDAVALHLPYLRRYARALTGSQYSGDQYALAALETVLVDPSLVSRAINPKAGLFNVFHMVWASAGAPVAEADSTLSAAAQAHMAQLTPNSREALLLSTIEGFSLAEIAAVLSTDVEEVQALVEMAMAEMKNTVAGRVMIIEDEAIIAMDLTAIIETMGHDVTGVARTHREAVKLALEETPDLILDDIQLADNSSGIEAVNEILGHFAHIPVIFVTAFPERLLTGERPEPAFLINKPYTEEQVRSAVSQAMFFASTETLVAN